MQKGICPLQQPIPRGRSALGTPWLLHDEAVQEQGSAENEEVVLHCTGFKGVCIRNFTSTIFIYLDFMTHVV